MLVRTAGYIPCVGARPVIHFVDSIFGKMKDDQVIRLFSKKDGLSLCDFDLDVFLPSTTPSWSFSEGGRRLIP